MKLWRAVLEKELLELRRSPILVLSLASLPLTIVALPLGLYAWLLVAAPDQVVDFLRELYAIPTEGGKAAVLASLLAKNWLPMFLVVPIFLPIMISAQSVGGERERRTLEPLLATPVSTLDIVLGKSVAAVVPSVVLTWTAAIIFCGGIDLLAFRWTHTLVLPDTTWTFSTLVIAPLLALFGNTLAVVLSSVIPDPRAAQNLAGMTVVPMLGALGAQLAGRVSLTWRFYVGFAVFVALLDVLMVYAASRAFHREKLLVGR